ncbi:hypothetical protein KEJ33_03205 [Candidatus Bathyarchaeota archaeon]|nr:hypothetical protein [Candidatus Bathyarchaeota archaeon]
MIVKLQGKVLNVEKTGDIIRKDGERWEKCIFTIEITRFSKRTSVEVIPEKFKGKKIKIIRYCCFDWHYRTNVLTTLGVNETDIVLKDKVNGIVY